MRIAVIADIHSNYLVFKKAIHDCKTKNIDKYIFLGDYVTDGFDANKVINIIKETDYYAINGNREISLIEYDTHKNKDWDNYIQWYSMKYGYDCLNKESLGFIKDLDTYKIINLGNKKICLSHSTPYNVMGDVFSNSYTIFDKLIKDFNCDIYLFGHEHKSYCTYYKNKYFINPGSIGVPTNGLPYKYGIIDIQNDTVNYENVNIDYNYKELENYYKNSDYYKCATQWCELLLQSMKDGKDHPANFLTAIQETAKQRNIIITKNIPNDIFLEVFEIYKQSKF